MEECEIVTNLGEFRVTRVFFTAFIDLNRLLWMEYLLKSRGCNPLVPVQIWTKAKVNRSSVTGVLFCTVIIFLRREKLPDRHSELSHRSCYSVCHIRSLLWAWKKGQELKELWDFTASLKRKNTFFIPICSCDISQIQKTKSRVITTW